MHRSISWYISARRFSSARRATQGDFQVSVDVNIWHTDLGIEGVKYLIILAEGVYGRFEFIGMLNRAQVVGPERVVLRAGVGQTSCPCGTIEGFK